MAHTPVIGISIASANTTVGESSVSRYTVNGAYAAAIRQAGGLPVLLPPYPGNSSSFHDRLDGLLLTGGGDVRPSLYGDQTIHSTTYGIDDERDSFEIELLRRAIDRDVPILCICRGIQTLNVALNGTLLQDISDELGSAIVHSQDNSGIPVDEPSHTVRINSGSLLHRMYNRLEIQVNSFHHQAIRDVGGELEVTAIAGDGIVEAVELSTCSWLLAVQWHPELMFLTHPEHLRPFDGLVTAAQRTLTRIG